MQGTIDEYTKRKALLNLAKEKAPTVYESLKSQKLAKFNLKLGALRLEWKNIDDPVRKKEIEKEAELIKEEIKLYE